MPVDLQRVRVSAQRTAGRGRDENFPADRDESTAVEAGLDVLDAPSPPQPSLRRRICRSVVPAVVSAAVLVLLWQLFVMSGVKPTYTVPGPGQVWSALVEEVTKGHAQAAVLNSLRRGAVGFGASVIVGTALALALAQLRFVRRGVGPLLTGLQSLPSVAWVPAAILWFGLADGAIYAVVLLGAVPSIANGLLAGIDQVPPAYRRVARVLGAGRWAEIVWVVLPAALPGYLGGLRQGWAFAWRSLMAAELIAYSPQLGPGLGQLLDTGRELSDMPLVLASVLLILFVGIGVEVTVFAPIERAVLRRRGLAGR
ncbi:MAG: ABC transporter permease [Dermatophilaceae bacterium]